MHEKNHRITNRRYGPKHPIPPNATHNEPLAVHESPYHTIDNCQSIYDMNLLPSQRSSIDPWDLENYDYVRRKIDLTMPPKDFCSDGSSPDFTSSPIENISNKTYYNLPGEVLTPTLPPKNLDTPLLSLPQRQITPLHQGDHYKSGHGTSIRTNNYDCIYQSDYNNVDGVINGYNHQHFHSQEYIMSMPPKFQHKTYNDYNGNRNSMTINNESSGDYTYDIMKGHSSLQRYEALKRQTLKTKISLPPQLKFPASPPPPPLLTPTIYDYCNPYAPVPYWSISDCYECLSQIYRTQSLYASMPSAGCCNMVECSLSSSSTLGRRRPSSQYSTIYGNKFGMSNKGLLQIDYSCSWHDLNRAMCRNY